MKKLLAVLMCALMLAACLSLGAYANEETTAADETTAAEEATTEEGATVERTADRVVFNADLASRPNCIVGMSGLAKGSGLSKKGEWEGVKKKGSGVSETFTVRRVSYGVGVERVFPLHSPNVDSIQVVRRGKVRRSKLYYLRDRVGKAAKVKQAL